MKVVFDTNILIDYLVGVEAARRELTLYTQPLISVITWIEVMVGARDGEETQLRAFLDRFDRVQSTIGQRRSPSKYDAVTGSVSQTRSYGRVQNRAMLFC